MTIDCSEKLYVLANVCILYHIGTYVQSRYGLGVIDILRVKVGNEDARGFENIVQKLRSSENSHNLLSHFTTLRTSMMLVTYYMYLRYPSPKSKDEFK